MSTCLLREFFHAIFKLFSIDNPMINCYNSNYLMRNSVTAALMTLTHTV